MADRYYLFVSSAGPARDMSRGTREQPHWDDHAAFVDRLVAEGRAVLGGPLVDEGGAVLVLRGTDERATRELLADDPWYVHGVLHLDAVKRWDLYINELP